MYLLAFELRWQVWNLEFASFQHLVAVGQSLDSTMHYGSPICFFTAVKWPKFNLGRGLAVPYTYSNLLLKPYHGEGRGGIQ
jgi:hypothetical protein